MILSDGTIRTLLAEGRIVIDPLEEGHIQPASVDVRLDTTFLAFRRHMTSDIDPWQTNDALMERVTVEEGKPFMQKPFTPVQLARKIREVLESREAGAA